MLLWKGGSWGESRMLLCTTNCGSVSGLRASAPGHSVNAGSCGGYSLR